MTETIAYDILVRSMTGMHTVMLTCVDPDGMLRSRPLPLLEVDADGALWIMFDRTDPGDIEIGSGQQVHVMAVNPGDDLYVAITGIASIHDDHALVLELWQDVHRHWFPHWPIRSHLAMLCVIPKSFRWWQGARAAQDADHGDA